MNINIEEYKSAKAFLPGLFKFFEDGLFSQAILAVTSNEFLFYDDHAPDVVSGDSLTYKIKLRLKFDDFETIVDEKIINNKDMSGLGRLNFVREEDNILFYYFEDDKKMLKTFLSVLKASGLSIQNRKVDLSKE